MLHSFPDANGTDGDISQGIDQTMTVKLFRRASSMLPKTPSRPDETSGEEEEEEEETTAAAASTTAPDDSELVHAKVD